jgi:co-chaperonin GroES (HSP10)
MSKALQVFEKLRTDDLKDHFILYGDNLLVEILPETDEEIKTKSGLVMATVDKQKLGSVNSEAPVFARVLHAGQGFYDTDGKTLPLDSRPGDIIVVGANSVIAPSRFGKIPMTKEVRLAFVSESAVMMRFQWQTGYDKVMQILQEGLSG